MNVDKKRLIPKVIYSFVETMIQSKKRKLSYILQQAKWKALHPECKMKATSLFPVRCVSVGTFSYGDLNVVAFNRNTCLRVGNFVSVAQNVIFFLDAEHSTKSVSTFPFKTKVTKSITEEAFSKGDIIIDDDVWIGYGAKILSGVHVSQGAVIAAGSIVTADVPPYAIVGGVPAKVIKYRFEQSVIDYLLMLDFSQITEEIIRDHIDDLYTEIAGMEIGEIKSLYTWFPKRQAT